MFLFLKKIFDFICIFAIFVVPLQPFLICGIVRVRVYILILGLLLCFTAAWAGDSIYVAADTLAADSIARDTLPADSTAKPQEVKKKSALSAPVHYQSSDSMVMRRRR
jgi:hypothetical protein